MKVLHVDASARFNRSHTRHLSGLFIQEFQKGCPDVEIIRRDLALVPPPHVTEEWIADAFSSQLRYSALTISDQLVDELFAADLYVFAVPMYNFSVPSVFKSYIDQIVRVGRTFSFDPNNREQPYQGLIKGKQIVLITARGDAGYGPNGPNRIHNHLDPYIADVFAFLGVDRLKTVAVEHDEFGGVSLKDSLRRAEEEVRLLARSYSSLSATDGWTEIARSAGTSVASAATVNTHADAIATEKVFQGCTP